MPKGFRLLLNDNNAFRLLWIEGFTEIGRNFWKKRLVVSFLRRTERVLRGAHCPVLAIPAQTN
jgi:hypothetical protein